MTNIETVARTGIWLGMLKNNSCILSKTRSGSGMTRFEYDQSRYTGRIFDR